MDFSAKHFTEVTPPPAESVFSEVANTFTSMRRVVSNFFELFSLEVRRASLTFTWMVVWGAIAAMFIVTTWLGLMGALALWIVLLGATWISAIVVISLANLLAAAVSLFVCVMISRDLLFPATRKQLDVSPIRSDAT